MIVGVACCQARCTVAMATRSSRLKSKLMIGFSDLLEETLSWVGESPDSECITYYQYITVYRLRVQGLQGWGCENLFLCLLKQCT